MVNNPEDAGEDQQLEDPTVQEGDAIGTTSDNKGSLPAAETPARARPLARGEIQCPRDLAWQKNISRGECLCQRLDVS